MIVGGAVDKAKCELWALTYTMWTGSWQLYLELEFWNWDHLLEILNSKTIGSGIPFLITAAPQPSLELLPDSLLLEILSLLDVHSLICLSRVCKRFHHLYTDEYIWSNVDLTSRSVGSKLDVRKLKKIVHDRIPPTLRRVKLSSNHPKKPPVVTASVLNDLFSKCPTIKNITLENCDLTTVLVTQVVRLQWHNSYLVLLTLDGFPWWYVSSYHLIVLSPSLQFPADCKFYHSGSLECITLTHCEVQFRWMETVRPEWPQLRYLSLASTAKISDYDLKCIASCKAWANSLRSVLLCTHFELGATISLPNYHESLDHFSF